MAPFRPVVTILRNILLKGHAYFSCCASCGDIRTPVEHRLCASLSPDFTVDAVVLPERESGTGLWSVNGGVASIREHMPWVRRIWVPEQHGTVAGEAQGVHTLRFGQAVRGRRERPHEADSGRVPEALLHLAEGLADYYIVIRESGLLCKNLLCLDFFTPNGIPLIFFEDRKKRAEQGETSSLSRDASRVQEQAEEPPPAVLAGIYAQTRDNAEAFARACAAPALSLDGPDYCRALGQWTYANARGIPCAWVYGAETEACEP